MNRKSLLFALMVLLFIPVARGQDAKFKALFMYNFTKYLEWPQNKQGGDFVIAILGNSPVANELKIIAQKKKVGSQSISIKQINGLEQATTCNILFIPQNKKVDQTKVRVHCDKKGTVIITEAPGLAKSFAGINYVKVNGRQNFEINKQNIEDQGIKINSQLLSLGIPVN